VVVVVTKVANLRGVAATLHLPVGVRSNMSPADSGGCKGRDFPWMGALPGFCKLFGSCAI